MDNSVNAADRSRNNSTEILPSSIAKSKSFVTFKRAVSVLDADDMLIGNHLTAYCSLCVAIFEIAQLSQALLT